jgi:hypothetical protein
VRFRHVQARDKFADFGVDNLQARLTQQRRDRFPDEEELLVFGGAEAVEDDGDAGRVCGRGVGEEVGDEEAGEVVAGLERFVADARLAVDAEPDTHVALGNSEERLRGTGHGAAGKRYAEAAGGGVGYASDPFDFVDVETCCGGRSEGLEDGEVAGDAAAL